MEEMPNIKELEILDFHIKMTTVRHLSDIWKGASPQSLVSRLQKVHVGNIDMSQAAEMEALMNIFGRKMVGNKYD